jgi:hypothetical protein
MEISKLNLVSRSSLDILTLLEPGHFNLALTELSQLGGKKGSHYVKCQPPNRTDSVSDSQAVPVVDRIHRLQGQLEAPGVALRP